MSVGEGAIACAHGSSRSLQCVPDQNEQLRVVLVGQRRERSGSKLARFQPVYSGYVYGYRFFSTDVWSVLEVVVLSLLLLLQPQARESSEIFLSQVE